jgi:hypothetical protein
MHLPDNIKVLELIRILIIRGKYERKCNFQFFKLSLMSSNSQIKKGIDGREVGREERFCRRPAFCRRNPKRAVEVEVDCVKESEHGRWQRLF